MEAHAAVGKSYPPTTYAVGREKIREYALRRRRDEPAAPRRRRGRAPPATPTSSRRRCSPSCTRRRRSRPAIFDPEVGINFALMVHGGQEFTWGAARLAGDEITTTVDAQGRRRARGDGLLRLRVRVRPTRTARPCASAPGPTSCEGREPCRRGDAIPELKVTPDKYLTVRYAGASGDFNPIHIDEEFAKQVGLPGRILHGLWTMAQVARAQTEAGGGPRASSASSVQFRGMGAARARGHRDRRRCARSRDGVAMVDTVAEQDGKAIIRNAEAELCDRRAGRGLPTTPGRC